MALEMFVIMVKTIVESSLHGTYADPKIRISNWPIQAWMDGCKDVCMDGWMDEWMNECRNGWMDE